MTFWSALAQAGPAAIGAYDARELSLQQLAKAKMEREQAEMAAQGLGAFGEGMMGMYGAQPGPMGGEAPMRGGQSYPQPPMPGQNSAAPPVPGSAPGMPVQQGTPQPHSMGGQMSAPATAAPAIPAGQPSAPAGQPQAQAPQGPTSGGLQSMGLRDFVQAVRQAHPDLPPQAFGMALQQYMPFMSAQAKMEYQQLQQAMAQQRIDLGYQNLGERTRANDAIQGRFDDRQATHARDERTSAFLKTQNAKINELRQRHAVLANHASWLANDFTRYSQGLTPDPAQLRAKLRAMNEAMALAEKARKELEAYQLQMPPEMSEAPQGVDPGQGAAPVDNRPPPPPGFDYPDAVPGGQGGPLDEGGPVSEEEYGSVPGAKLAHMTDATRAQVHADVAPDSAVNRQSNAARAKLDAIAAEPGPEARPANARQADADWTATEAQMGGMDPASPNVVSATPQNKPYRPVAKDKSQEPAKLQRRMQDVSRSGYRPGGATTEEARLDRRATRRANDPNFVPRNSTPQQTAFQSEGTAMMERLDAMRRAEDTSRAAFERSKPGLLAGNSWDPSPQADLAQSASGSLNHFDMGNTPRIDPSIQQMITDAVHQAFAQMQLGGAVAEAATRSPKKKPKAQVAGR